MSALYGWVQQHPVHAPSNRGTPGLSFEHYPPGNLLFGGLGTAPQLKPDTFSWDGSDWTVLAPAAKPSARNAPAMAYDASRDQVVLFGGVIDLAGNGDQQTWTFDGTNWTQQFPVSKPSARAAASMWYDQGFGRIRLFGGRTNPLGPVYSNETWTWDGTNWTQGAPATPPPALADPIVVYDVNRFEAVLFGGNIIGTGVQNQTWTFDGSEWTQRSPARSPPARQAPWGAWFQAADAVVVYGGLVPPAATFADLWEWRGTTWADVTPGSGPSARYGPGAAVDANTAKPMLFGGISGAGAFLGETWFLDVVGFEYETAWAYGGVAPQGGGDRTSPLYRQSALPELELTPGCTIKLRAQKPDGTLRAGDRWTEATIWVDDGS